MKVKLIPVLVCVATVAACATIILLQHYPAGKGYGSAYATGAKHIKQHLGTATPSQWLKSKWFELFQELHSNPGPMEGFAPELLAAASKAEQEVRGVVHGVLAAFCCSLLGI
jgi:hypothetical protein